MASAGCEVRIRSLGKAVHFCGPAGARWACLLCLANADEATEARRRQPALMRSPDLEMYVSSASDSHDWEPGSMRSRTDSSAFTRSPCCRVESDCKVHARPAKRRESTSRVQRDREGTLYTKHGEIRFLPGFLPETRLRLSHRSPSGPTAPLHPSSRRGDSCLSSSR